ncbi:MAG: hypothetical protein JXA37_00375 [Chloroflexia bacterium]|nr:hypothetical protein [Chloroflexia bacterium]
MITTRQFDAARQFIYRHGDLLTRRRFAYHFERGPIEAVLDVLACYQNSDGGFGHGLELDILCPDSSGICAEVAFGYLVELGVGQGPLFERGLQWVVSAQTADGDLPHPVDAVTRYPHGPWWKQDHGRILSLAGLLGKLGHCPPEVSRRAAAILERYLPFPQELEVYDYPVALYLRYGDPEGIHRQHLGALEAAFLSMLGTYAWHHPLFFRPGRWEHDGIPASLWEAEAEKAVAALQDDGGVWIERYARLSWWRPVWTVDLLVTLNYRGFLAENEQGPI